MRIPYLDLAAENAPYREAFSAVFERVVRGGRYILGGEVAAFEHEFAAYLESEYAIGVSSGTSALTLILRTLDPRSRVAVPAHTADATYVAIVDAGHKAIPVDVRSDTHTLDFTLLKKIDADAVVNVHMAGNPSICPDEIADTLSDRLFWIDDCAQSFGALVGGKPLPLGRTRVQAHSFYPTKNLGALGDGGAIVTYDLYLEPKLRAARNYGKIYRDDEIKEVGQNARLDELQAALLRIKLADMPRVLARKHAIAAIYKKHLSDLEGPDGLHLQKVMEGCTHAYHLFPILVNFRQALAAYLTEKGIGTEAHYQRLPIHHRAFRLFANGHYPNAERICAQNLSLPIGAALTDEQAEEVAYHVRRYFTAGGEAPTA